MTTLNLSLPILPLTIAATGDRAAAGVVTAVVAAFTIVFELRTAALLRRLPQKNLLVMAMLIQAIAMAGFAGFRGLPAMLLFGALAGAGFGVVATVTASAVGSLAPPGRHGEAIGYYGLSASLPTIFAPPAALLLLDASGPVAVFATGAAACGLGVLVATRLTDSGYAEAALPGGGVLATLHRPGVLGVWLAFACTTVTYGAIVSFTPFLLGTSGWDSAPTFLLLFGLSRAVTRFASGRLIDAFGDGRLVLPSLVVGALALALLPGHTALLVVVSATVYGAALGVIQTGAFVAMLRATGPGLLANVSGIWNMGVDAGFGAGALLLAPVAAVAGYARMFWLLPALFALAFVIRLGSRRPAGGRPGDGPVPSQ